MIKNITDIVVTDMGEVENLFISVWDRGKEFDLADDNVITSGSFMIVGTESLYLFRIWLEIF